jgi:hypothetical protein
MITHNKKLLIELFHNVDSWHNMGWISEESWAWFCAWYCRFTVESMTERAPEGFHNTPSDAPVCAECGSIMNRSGSCYTCGNCGGTSGCS